MYFYKAYELIFQSELQIPEFPVTEESERVDVHIRLGKTPEKLESPSGKGVVYEATANQFLMNMHDIARYLVQNGNEIIIEPDENSLESDVRVFFLGSCIGALLHQRGLLVIHAGVINTPKGAVLFTGPSGVGKSTTLGELMRRGYQMMVDDVCGVVLNDEGIPMALPGYPRTRLWADSAKKLEQNIEEMERTRPQLEKYERQLPEQFWAQPARLHRIYLLSTNNKGELSITKIPAINAFRVVLFNTYRQQFLDGLEMRAPHFAMATAVAKHSGIARITRPSHPFMLTELVDMIEQDLEQN